VRAEPIADTADESLRRGRARRDAHDLHAREPALVDLRGVVDEMRVDTGCARDLDES
jgi:hypothetical protein